MNKFYFYFLLLTLIIIAQLQAQVVTDTLEKKYVPIDFATQSIEGYLGHWIENAIDDELFRFPIEDYVFPYYTSGITNGRWITGEFTGKYMHSMCMAYEYKYPKNPWIYKELKSRMDIIFHAWRHFQKQNNGYAGIHISNDRKPWQDLWNVWHVKYVLLGLIKYYELFGYQDALDGAMALGDHFISEFGEGKRGFDGSDLGPVFLESMTLLYKHTEEQKYLDHCYWIIEHQIRPELIDLINNEQRLPFKHVYTLQSHLISTLYLYEIDSGKNPEFLEAAENAVELMVKNKMFLTGGFGTTEHFTTDHVFGCTNKDHPQEACTAAHFIYLCRKLFYLTGKSKYIDYIEHTLYNAALTSKNPHNGFETSYHSPLQGHKEWKETHHKNGTPCCSQSITRELVWLPEILWVKDNSNGAAVLLYNQGNFSDTLFNKQGENFLVKADIKTDFPKGGEVDILLDLEKPENFGVVRLNEQDEIIDFVEKPQGFVSNLALVGAYYIKDAGLLKKELDALMEQRELTAPLTDVLKAMMHKGIFFEPALSKKWFDCEDMADLLAANRYYLEKIEPMDAIEEGASVDSSIIHSPVFIGRGAKIKNAVIGPHVSIAEGAQLEDTVVKNSIIQEGSEIRTFCMENSVVSKNQIVRGNAVQGFWNETDKTPEIQPDKITNQPKV